MVDEIAPVGDEIVLPKSSSSVFVSTHIDYVLRNLGVNRWRCFRPASNPHDSKKILEFLMLGQNPPIFS